MADILKALIQSPPALLLCLGLVLVLLAILGRSPLPSLTFVLGRAQRITVAAIGLALAVTGLVFLLPQPSRFALGGTVLDQGSRVPVSDAIVEAHDDATNDKANHQVKTDDRGSFYLNYGKDDEGRYVRLRVVKENFAVATRYALIKARPDTLILELAKAGPIDPPVSGSATRPSRTEGALDFTPLRSVPLVVWISSEPRSYSSSIATSFARDFPTGKLLELDIPRNNFVARVQARSAEDTPPDVAFIDNYFQLEPLLRAGIIWSAWGTSRFATRGWWVIFKDTKRLAQAQAFVRWLNRAPGWQPRAKNISIPPAAILDVQKISMTATRHIMSGNQTGLESLLDKDAARARMEAVDRNTQVSDVQPILTFGNSRIAFVLLAVLASAENFYGMRHMVFILRNQGDGWRILQMDPDARMPDGEGAQGMDASPTILRAFDLRITADRMEQPPLAAVLLDPPDRARLPRFPVRPDIAWRSEAPDVDFVIEAQFANPDEETSWSVSYLTFSEAPRSAPAFRERAPFGVGAQPHRWRVWTLGRSGAVSLSPWRTVLYVN